MNNTDVRLIIINQTTNKAFREWVKALAHELGQVELWSSDIVDDMGGLVTVRQGPSYDRRSALSRLLSWGRFTAIVWWWLVRPSALPQHTPIFVVTNPPFLPLLAWLLHRLQKRPYGLLEWDIYPHVLVPMGLLSRRHVLFRFWQAWHQKSLREAGVVITIGEQMAARLRDIANDELLPVQVIPNWVDTEWMKPIPRSENPFAQKYRLDEQLVVMYAGNLGATHSIETIIAVSEILRNEFDIRFLIIGDGTKRQLVETAIRTKSLTNSQLLPLQPLEFVPYSLASADIGVVTLAKDYEGLSMPSKTYNLLAAGNALLGISQSPNDLSDTINLHGCGANFGPSDVPDIARWLKSLSLDRTALANYKKAARQAAEQFYGRQRCEAVMTRALWNWLYEK